MSVIMTRFFLLAIMLQAEIHLGYSQYLAQSFSRCFPYNFNQTTEIRDFDKLLVIPRLATKSLRDLSHYELAPENNMRYNEYLSCVWKDGGYQSQGGTIDFATIENALANTIAREDAEPSDNNLRHFGGGTIASRRAASNIVGSCGNLWGSTDGHKVVLVRNCILTNVKNSGRY